MHLLRKLLRSDLIRGSGLYLVASTVSSAIPFILLPILTRYLSPEEYGEVAMFTVLLSFIGAFTGLSVHGAANRKYFDYKDELEKLAEYIFMCLVILFISSFCVLLSVSVFANYFSQFLSLPIPLLLLAVPVSALSFITSLRLGQWQVQKEPKKYGAFQIGQSAINGLLSVFLVVSLYLGVTGRILGISISILIFSIVAFISLYRTKLIKICWKPHMAKEALNFGVPLIPHTIGLFLISSLDRVVITNQLGLAQAGIYMVAIQLSLAATLILRAVNQSFVPWLFERLKSESFKDKLNIVRVTYIYYVLLLFGVFIGFSVGGEILRFIVGPEYHQAAELVGWVFLAKGFHGGYLMVTNYLFYAKKTGVLSSITISTGVLNIILLLVLIKYFDLIGVVWAYCISKFVQWVAVWYLANKFVEMPWLIFFRKNNSV